MEKKKTIILIMTLAVIAIIITAGLVVVNSYTLYKDHNIEVEVPYGTVFNTSEIRGLAPDNINTYDQLKKQSKDRYNTPITQDKYEGNIYEGNRNDEGKYIITLYFDKEKTVVTLKATDLDTLIHMAETFQLAEGFNNSGWEEDNTQQNSNNDHESSLPSKADWDSSSTYDDYGWDYYLDKDGDRIYIDDYGNKVYGGPDSDYQ